MTASRHGTDGFSGDHSLSEAFSFSVRVIWFRVGPSYLVCRHPVEGPEFVSGILKAVQKPMIAPGSHGRAVVMSASIVVVVVVLQWSELVKWG